MPPTPALPHHGDTESLDPATHAGVVVMAPQQKESGALRWVQVLGIGGVLVWLMVQNQMKQSDLSQQFLQDQFKEQNQISRESTKAMTQAADSMEDLTGAVGTLVQGQQELSNDLAPLLRNLDRVADAVEAVAEESAEAQP